MLSPCSVITVRDGLADKKGFLICTDGTEHCTKSMKQAAVLAHGLKRPVTIMSVGLEKSHQARIKAQLAAAREELKALGLDNAKTIARFGDPVEEVLAAAKRFAVVVVADSGKSRVKRFLRGSIAFNIMGRAAVSALNVR
jgi:nucleotide-binding universal stress UspA family protein